MYKGVIFNVVSSILFVVVGYLIHFVLGASMTPAQYGIIGSILTIMDFEYLFLNNGVRQSLAKELSKEKFDTKDIICKCLVFQFVLIGIMFSINFFGAGVIAKSLNDKSLNLYLKYAALLMPINGLYVITIGINEGFRRFSSSAFIGIVYAIFKLLTIPFVMFIFEDPILGTEMGFLAGLTAALIFGIFTLIKVRDNFKVKRNNKIDTSSFIKNTLNFSTFFIIVSVVLSVDTLIVKAIANDKDMAGFYTGAVNFAKVSYFVLSAFFNIILPTVTRYYTEGNTEKVKYTIRSMFSIIFTFVMPITMIISSSGKVLLSSFYGEKYEYAGNVLAILAVSHFLMGLVVMFNMIISATNHRRFSSILAVAMVIGDVALGILLTKQWGINGTAVAGGICTTIAVIVSGLYMLKLIPNVITAKQVKMLSFNLALWIFVKLLFEILNINNIIILGIVYFILYITCILFMQLIHLVDIKQLLKEVKNK